MGDHSIPDPELSGSSAADAAGAMVELSKGGFTELQAGQVPATQTLFPWRSTARTVFQAGVGFAAMAPLLVDASGIPEGTAGVGAALAISAGITRVMALPAVDEFLRRWVPWLAAAPTN